jgi:hypothetical protein
VGGTKFDALLLVVCGLFIRTVCNGTIELSIPLDQFLLLLLLLLLLPQRDHGDGPTVIFKQLTLVNLN